MPVPESDPVVVAPVITPFDGKDRVDHDAVGRNVERWLTTPLDGFLIGSATGEEWFLSETEKLDILKTVKQALGGRGFVVGGVDCPSVTETLKRAGAFADAGADMVRIRIPRYASAVEAYFEQVLPRSPLPVVIIHQSNPELFGLVGRTAATPEVIGRVTSMENVFGYITDHDPRFESQVRRYVPEDRRFWICNGSLVLFGTLIGCNGTNTAFANVWPAALHELLTMGLSGRYEEARSLQTKVQNIDAIMLRYGATGVKAALNLLGYDGTRPRAPMPPMPPNEVARLETEMRAAGLLEG